MAGLPFYRLNFLMPSPGLELRTLASYTVILHDNLQRESYQPDCPTTSVTWFQVLCEQTNPVWLQEHTFPRAHDYAHSSSLCGVSLWSLTLPAAWVGEFAELILLYRWVLGAMIFLNVPGPLNIPPPPLFIALPTARDIFAWQWATKRAILFMLYMNRWLHCSVHKRHWTSSCTGTIVLKQLPPYPSSSCDRHCSPLHFCPCDTRTIEDYLPYATRFTCAPFLVSKEHAIETPLCLHKPFTCDGNVNIICKMSTPNRRLRNNLHFRAKCGQP